MQPRAFAGRHDSARGQGVAGVAGPIRVGTCGPLAVVTADVSSNGNRRAEGLETPKSHNPVEPSACAIESRPSATVESAKESAETAFGATTGREVDPRVASTSQNTPGRDGGRRSRWSAPSVRQDGERLLRPARAFQGRA